MTDDELQQLLRDTLPPPAFEPDDDASIEALLETQEASDPAYGQGMLARARIGPASGRKKPSRWMTIAALIVLTAIPIAIFAIATSAPENSPKPTAQAPASAEPGNLGDGLVEHHPEFPAPIFTGTPFEIKLPNLEPARSPRLTFSAPADVHLISHGSPVSCSTSAPLVGSLSMVTDGNKIGDDSHLLELPPGPQWVQIDLGESQKIFAITLWHYHKMWRAYRDVVILASDDPQFGADTHTVFNSDHDNSLGLGSGNDLAYIETEFGRIIDVAGISARYVRLYSNGNTHDDLNHYVEVEIYGM